MKNLLITIFVLLILIVLGLYLVSFQVRETESALVTTFGKPARQIKSPGWYFKWPVPIQYAYKFDSRMRVLEAELSETATKNTTPIIVNTYIVWKISEPLEFFNSVGTIKEAETKLLHLIDAQNKVIGKYSFSDFINSDESKIKIEQIQAEMLGNLQEAVSGVYGVEIKTLGIKQLKISEDVTKSVFERMGAERSRKAADIITQGIAQAEKIKAEANAKQIELLVAAETRANAIRAQGDAEAAQYYKMLEADPELAMFLRDVDALKGILKNRSTIILSADTEPFKLLKQIPSLKPKK